MLRKGLFAFCFLLAVMTLTPSQGQCENWKEFHKDGDRIWYYDKDSIHYPQTKKNIFGLTVQNKEIVNVWTYYKESAGFSDSRITRIYCAERVCQGCGFMKQDPSSLQRDDLKFLDLQYKGPDGPREPIEPGSGGESLLKKICP
jgi:hypothetical protein